MGEADGLSRVIADSSVDDFEDPEVALCLVITRRRSRIGEKSVIWSFARPSRGSNPHFRFSGYFRLLGIWLRRWFIGGQRFRAQIADIP